MSLNDLMSDYVARVNNARMAKNESVHVLKNKLAVAVSKKLTTLGYIKGFIEEGYDLILDLNLDRIHAIKRVSRPGQRVYTEAKKSPRITGGIGFTIVTTSQGVMTHVEAKKHNTGGEVLFQIY